MDLSNLLCGLKALGVEDQRCKREALEFAFSRWLEIKPATVLTDFLGCTPLSVLGQVFGSAANDFYVTALMSCVAQSSGPFDAVAAAVLNRIVLQLNFQTRFIHSGGSPEIFLLDGAPELFLPAMANGNAVFGFQVDDDQTSKTADWSSCSHIDLSPGALFWRQIKDFPSLMEAILRDRIGCLALCLPNIQAGPEIDMRKRYAAVADNFHDDSFFVLIGPPQTVFTGATKLERVEPEARIQLRVYDLDTGERRAIMVASHLSRLPELTLRNAHT